MRAATVRVGFGGRIFVAAGITAGINYDRVEKRVPNHLANWKDRRRELVLP